MNELNLDEIKQIYCIGVGGIGVSAIARMMLHEGKKVSGSDGNRSSITDDLEKIGVKVNIGHDTKNIPENTDLIVYTGAVKDDNPELIYGRENNIPTLLYSETLGLISKNKRTVAIAGTHGKTTTTAMIAKILIDCGLSPTVIVGSLLKEYKSNFVGGKSDILVVEACEYLRSFLELNPNIIVITNIDSDHLDYYKDLDEIKKTFREFTDKLRPDDHLVCNCGQKNMEEICGQENGIIHNVSELKTDIEVGVPGKHNKENALLAFQVGKIFECDDEKIKKSLKEFSGTWRRFEHKGETKEGAIIYDDYAHHPEEIKATIQAVREKFPDKKLFIIFQPHLYSRTKLLLKDFAKNLSLADEIAILPIYAAREKEDKSIHSSHLVDEISKINKNVKLFSDFDEIKKYVSQNTNKDNIIFTIGAGDVTLISDEIKVK